MSNDNPNRFDEPGQGPPPPPSAHANAAPIGESMPAAPQYGGGMPSYSPAPAGPVTRPKSMDIAVRLMQAGGVLSIVSMLSVFIMQDSLRDEATKSMRQTNPNITQSQIDAGITFIIALSVVMGLIGASLWFWMALANGRGRSWARIVASVLFVISLLLTLLSFGQAASSLARILGLLSLAVGAGAIFFMYQKDSTAYYNAVSGPRR